jgi:hypothetical protein
MTAAESLGWFLQVKRSDDRLPAMMGDPSPGSAGPQDRFGMLEVGGPLDATTTIRDAHVFELDPLRRATRIAKREARRARSSKEPGRLIAA